MELDFSELNLRSADHCIRSFAVSFPHYVVVIYYTKCYQFIIEVE